MECVIGGRSVQLLDEVRSAWGWVGIEQVDIMDDNEFGNLILRDVRGQCWRLCPENFFLRGCSERSRRTGWLGHEPGVPV